MRKEIQEKKEILVILDLQEQKVRLVQKVILVIKVYKGQLDNKDQQERKVTLVILVLKEILVI